MKQDTFQKKTSLLDDKSKIVVNKKLDEQYEKDINSPFMKRKMAQARAFLNKAGLPEGWGEWKKSENSK